jgi:hypothetical protein
MLPKADLCGVNSQRGHKNSGPIVAAVAVRSGIPPRRYDSRSSCGRTRVSSAVQQSYDGRRSGTKQFAGATAWWRASSTREASRTSGIRRTPSLASIVIYGRAARCQRSRYCHTATDRSRHAASGQRLAPEESNRQILVETATHDVSSRWFLNSQLQSGLARPPRASRLGR